MRTQDKQTTSQDEHARRILIEQDPIEDDDASAIAAYEAAEKANEESFPAWMVERLIAGDHPLKVFREYRGLTDEQLAESAGTPVSLLSPPGRRADQEAADVGAPRAFVP